MVNKKPNVKEKQINIAALLTSFLLVAAAVFLVMFQASFWRALALLLITALIVMLWHTSFSDIIKRHSMHALTVAALFIIAVALPDRKEMALFFSWIVILISLASFDYVSLVYMLAASFGIMYYLFFHISIKLLEPLIYLTIVIILILVLLKRHQRQLHNMQDQIKQNLYWQSRRDPLTDLPNRLLLMECLTKAIEQGANDYVAIIFFDLDGFKKINDTAGHNVGDHLLIKISERITGTLKNELLARYGGDEFVVLIPRVSRLQEIDVVTQEIKASFEEAFVIGGNDYTMSACMGISVYPTDSQDPQELIFIADMAMLKAKRERQLSLVNKNHQSD